MFSNMVRISIEGIIGTGKSSLIRNLKDVYVCYEEPVEKWTLLPYMYENVKDYGTALQFQILLSQFDQYEQFKNIKHVIIERSPWSARNIFAPFILDQASMKIYDDMHKKLTYDVDFYIYLHLDPKTAFQRVQMRGRLYERNITIDYLEKLSQAYEKKLTMTNVYYVDASLTPLEIEREVRKILKRITR